jgi:hypothetical protein
MNLTAENTAIVLDSTADFPEGPELFANWRIVPLYVNLGGESYRDYVDLAPDDLYARLESGESATTSQPTPGDFLAVYEELAPHYERIYSLQLSSTLSGTFESAKAAASGMEPVRVVDTRTVSAAVAMLALAVQRRLERGTTDNEIDALVERYLVTHGLLFTVDTLDYLARGGRIGRGAAFAGTLLSGGRFSASRRRGRPAQASGERKRSRSSAPSSLVQPGRPFPNGWHAVAPSGRLARSDVRCEAAGGDRGGTAGAVVGAHAWSGRSAFWFDDPTRPTILGYPGGAEFLRPRVGRPERLDEPLEPAGVGQSLSRKLRPPGSPPRAISPQAPAAAEPEAGEVTVSSLGREEGGIRGSSSRCRPAPAPARS